MLFHVTTCAHMQVYVSPITVWQTLELFTLADMFRYRMYQPSEVLYGCKHQSDRQLLLDHYTPV